jgi:hypothetical protein
MALRRVPLNWPLRSSTSGAGDEGLVDKLVALGQARALLVENVVPGVGGQLYFAFDEPASDNRIAVREGDRFVFPKSINRMWVTVLNPWRPINTSTWDHLKPFLSIVTASDLCELPERPLPSRGLQVVRSAAASSPPTAGDELLSLIHPAVMVHFVEVLGKGDVIDVEFSAYDATVGPAPGPAMRAPADAWYQRNFDPPLYVGFDQDDTTVTEAGIRAASVGAGNGGYIINCGFEPAHVQ